MSKEQDRERAVIEEVNALPDTDYVHCYDTEIRTDDLKLLAAGAERAGALEAALRDLTVAADGAYYHLNNTLADDHTATDCQLCKVADPLGDALVTAKAALKENVDE